MPTEPRQLSSIAIVIPVYNGQDYLAQAVRSALDQTLAPADICIVDDASSDGTAGVISEFSDETTVRSYRLSQRLPASGAWNAAVRATAGDYIVVLAHDDVIDPELCQAAADVIAAHADVDLICFGNDDITSTGELIETHPMQSSGLPTGVILLTERFLDRFCADGQFFLPSAVVMSRRIFDRISGFDQRLQVAYDWDFYLRAAAAGAKILLHDRVLCRYRIHATQSIQTFTHNDNADLPLLFDKMTQLREILSEKHCRLLVEGMCDFMRQWVARLVRNPVVPVQDVLNLRGIVSQRLDSWASSSLPQARYVKQNPTRLKRWIAWQLTRSRIGILLLRRALAMKKVIRR